MPHPFTARTARLLACTIAAPFMAWAGTGTTPVSVPWTLEAVVAHPQWTDFSRAVVTSHLRGSSEAALREACRERLEDGAPLGTDPVAACIGSALRSLDESSTYLDPVEYARRRAPPPVGVGIEIGAKAPGLPLPVLGPLPGTPSERAGIQRGDSVIEVDGIDLLPLTVEGCIRAMRGAEGTVMNLVLRRKGQAEPIRLSIPREPIRLVPTEVMVLGGDVVHARIRRFTDTTASSLVEQLRAVRLPRDRPPAGLVVDLRFNGGGGIETLVSTAAAFAPPDTPVVHLVSRNTTEVKRTAAQPALPPVAWLDGVPLLVLVGERTSSGAEAFAQFLREARGATLMGQRTWGGTEVHQLVTLGSDAAVELLIARMVSPRGQRWPDGLAPDIVQERTGSLLLIGTRADPALQRAVEWFAERPTSKRSAP